VSFECRFAVGSEDIDWLGDLLVDILNEFLNGFVENLPLGAGKAAMVAGEAINPPGAFLLFEVAK
jgi:hypothetical protein